ncbi:hypothetical protein LTR04_000788, partial [Oleoguttula sp. CCFEE 6159]
MGTFVDKAFTPLLLECTRLLEYLASITPGFTKVQKVLNSVKFEGDDYPSIPGSVKSVALTAVLHAMAGIVGQEISEMKGQKTGQITVNTDQVGLWLETPMLVFVNGKGAAELIKSGEIASILPITDKGIFDSPLRYRGWAMYQTKTPNTWYQIHTSLTPAPVFKALGIDPDAPGIKTKDQAYAHIQDVIRKYTARELEMIHREIGACGVTCYTPRTWKETSMGQSLARHPLINYEKQNYVPETPPVPFSTSNDKRPLAGVKVVGLARVIAAPALCAGLAAFGADVVRVMSPHMPDVS